MFRDHRDRSHFLELLEECRERFRLRMLAFVLMDNHYHLLIELTEPNLSEAVRWLNLSYSVWFNRRHRRAGYLFQGRFKSILVDPISCGYGLSAYIHLNPVRTGHFGLSKTDRQHDRAGVGAAPMAEQVQARIDTLRAYRWSSYRAYCGLASRPAWLEAAEVLNTGGGDPARQKQNYRRYVEDQIRQGRMNSPWEELKDQIFLGAVDFIDDLKKSARCALGREKTPGWLRERVSFETVIQAVERIKGEPWNVFKDRHGDGGAALVATLARKTTGLTLSALAAKLEVKRPANITMTIQRYQQKIRRDPREKRIAHRAAEMLNVSI
jgi:REP element-mobilizing transposase RayT